MRYFTPTKLEENDQYKILEGKLEDLPDNVNLIGFRGEKGIGKSSFFKTFFEKHDYNYRIITFNYSDLTDEEYGIIKLYDQIIRQLTFKSPKENKIYKIKKALNLNVKFRNWFSVGYGQESEFSQYLEKLRVENEFLNKVTKIINKNDIKYVIFEDFDVINYKLLDMICQLKIMLKDCKIIVPINYSDILDNDETIGVKLEKIFDVIIPMYNANDSTSKFIDLFQFFSKNVYSHWSIMEDGVFEEQQKLLLDIITTSQIYKLDNRKINNLKNMIDFRIHYNSSNNPINVIYYSVKEMIKINEGELNRSDDNIKSFSLIEEELPGTDNEQFHNFIIANKNAEWNKLLEFDDFYADLNEKDAFSTKYGDITLREIKKLTMHYMTRAIRDEELTNQFLQDIREKWFSEEEIIKAIETPYISSTTLCRSYCDEIIQQGQENLAKEIITRYELIIEDFSTHEGLQFLMCFISDDDLDSQITSFENQLYYNADYSYSVELFEETLSYHDIPEERKEKLSELTKRLKERITI